MHNKEIEIKQFGKPEILVGDKVIQRKNNYTLGIMNGSMGIVKAIKIDRLTGKEILEIDFGFDKEQEIVLIPNNSDYLEHLELAYCITCHSSQGSEWPLVIVVITDKISTMLKHQNWLYTAVTRARESVIIMTDQRGAKNAAINPDKDKRQTFAQFYLSQFTDSDYAEAPNTPVNTREESAKKESLPEAETDCVETIFKTQVELQQVKLLELQEPAINGIKCSSCNYALADTTIIENGEKISLCESCYWGYLEDHNINIVEIEANKSDSEIANSIKNKERILEALTTIPSPTSTPTVNTTSILTDTPIPIITEQSKASHEIEKLEERAEPASNQQAENQNTINSGLSLISNNLVENKVFQSVQSKNLPLGENKQYRVVKKKVNLFTDILADSYPFWHEIEVKEEII
jgi:hypothetical protein